MQREFEFRIKEVGIRKWHVIRSIVDIPENFDVLEDWQQRQHFIKPNGYSINYHGATTFATSRFENICHMAGIENMVADFKYHAT